MLLGSNLNRIFFMRAILHKSKPRLTVTIQISKFSFMQVILSIVTQLIMLAATGQENIRENEISQF